MEITKKRALLDLLGPKFSISNSSNYLYYKNKCVGVFTDCNSLEVVDEKFGAFIERNNKYWNITVGIRSDLHKCPNFDKSSNSSYKFAFWCVLVVILNLLISMSIIFGKKYVDF